MKNKLKYLPLLALCLLMLFSCKKDDEEVMPDYTTTGAKTFGAYVNGKLWVPSGRPGFFEPNFYVYMETGNTLEIMASRQVKDNPPVFEKLRFGMSGVDHEGIYYWNSPGNAYFFSESCDYHTDFSKNKDGWLEITKFDLQNGIIAGKFEFTLIEPGCDTIRVTGGRFDSKF